MIAFFLFLNFYKTIINSFYTEQENLIFTQLDNLLNEFKKEIENYVNQQTATIFLKSKILLIINEEEYINQLTKIFENQINTITLTIQSIKQNNPDLDLFEEYLEELEDLQEYEKQIQLFNIQNKNKEINFKAKLQLQLDYYSKLLKKKRK